MCSANIEVSQHEKPVKTDRSGWGGLIVITGALLRYVQRKLLRGHLCLEANFKPMVNTILINIECLACFLQGVLLTLHFLKSWLTLKTLGLGWQEHL